MFITAGTKEHFYQKLCPYFRPWTLFLEIYSWSPPVVKINLGLLLLWLIYYLLLITDFDTFPKYNQKWNSTKQDQMQKLIKIWALFLKSCNFFLNLVFKSFVEVNLFSISSVRLFFQLKSQSQVFWFWTNSMF